MRRTALAIALGLPLILMARGAQAAEPGFSFGVRGQLTSNWFTGGLGDAFDDGTMGWGGGLVLEWQLSESLGIGVATLYSRVTADGIFEIEGTPVDSALKIEWIEIPVYIKSGEGVYMTAGVSSRFQISSTFGDDAALIELEDGFEDAEYSVLVGIGADLPIGTNRLQLGVDFQLGISETVAAEEVSGRINTLVLRAAVLF